MDFMRISTESGRNLTSSSRTQEDGLIRCEIFSNFTDLFIDYVGLKVRKKDMRGSELYTFI